MGSLLLSWGISDSRVHGSGVSGEADLRYANEDAEESADSVMETGKSQDLLSTGPRPGKAAVCVWGGVPRGGRGTGTQHSQTGRKGVNFFFLHLLVLCRPWTDWTLPPRPGGGHLLSSAWTAPSQTQSEMRKHLSAQEAADS